MYTTVKLKVNGFGHSCVITFKKEKEKKERKKIRGLGAEPPKYITILPTYSGARVRVRA